MMTKEKVIELLQNVIIYEGVTTNLQYLDERENNWENDKIEFKDIMIGVYNGMQFRIKGEPLGEIE